MCDISLRWALVKTLNEVYDYLRITNVISIVRTNDDRWFISYMDDKNIITGNIDCKINLKMGGMGG